MALIRTLRRFRAPVLVILLTALWGCTFERRPNGEPRGDRSPSGTTVPGGDGTVEGAGTTPADSVHWAVQGFQESLAVGDLSEALAFLHREVDLVYGPPTTSDPVLSPGERLLRELRWRQEGERSFTTADRRVSFLNGMALVWEQLILHEGTDPAPVAAALQTMVLVPGEEGWEIRVLHRTLGLPLP